MQVKHLKLLTGFPQFQMLKLKLNAPLFTRFIKAKVNMLTKQMEEGLELRKKMDEQNKDLQRQLKTEREENKNLSKRFVDFTLCMHLFIDKP